MPAVDSWQPLAALLAEASKVVAFTGAGISTVIGSVFQRNPRLTCYDAPEESG